MALPILDDDAQAGMRRLQDDPPTEHERLMVIATRESLKTPIMLQEAGMSEEDALELVRQKREAEMVANGGVPVNGDSITALAADFERRTGRSVPTPDGVEEA